MRIWSDDTYVIREIERGGSGRPLGDTHLSRAKSARRRWGTRFRGGVPGLFVGIGGVCCFAQGCNLRVQELGGERLCQGVDGG